MPAEAQDELFDYFAPEASYDGNLAHQPLREEPSPAKAPAPKKTPQVTKKSLPLWKRATVLVAVLMVAGGLLMIAAGYSQLFTAKQKLAQMQEQLQEQIQNTAVLENGTAEDMTLSELYEYATGTLGMREATGSEITQMGSLDNGYTVQQMQEEAVRKPTQVRFHLFGGKD